MDVVDNTSDNNCGLKKRGAFTNAGAEVGLVGVPLCDLFNTNKLLLDNIEIKIKIDLFRFRYYSIAINTIPSQGM